MNWINVLFAIVFILVYGLMNYYYLRKHNNTLTLSSGPRLLIRSILMLVILTPFATMALSYFGPPFLASITGFTGFSWLAFLFLFLVIHGIADLILVVAERLGLAASKATVRVLFVTTLLICVSILIYGSIEAKQLEVEHVDIPTAKLPAGSPPITIAQISDVHFSPIIGVEMANRIKAAIVLQKPDIIVLTGDLLDRGVRDPEAITATLNSIHAPDGKFAVTGNHEFFAGIDKSTAFIERSGFNLLRNRAVAAAPGITIAGVDDPTVLRYDKPPAVSEHALLAGLDRKRFTLLLKHQPRIDEASTGLFDLQLSGHTHAGQIFPFTLLVQLVFHYISGLYILPNNSYIYVSRGTGTWGPPFRFMATPEITIVRLLPKAT